LDLVVELFGEFPIISFFAAFSLFTVFAFFTAFAGASSPVMSTSQV
jgi:hypothetical protein